MLYCYNAELLLLRYKVGIAWTCLLRTGVARIFSGGALIFPENVDDLFLFILFIFSHRPQKLYKSPQSPQKIGLLLRLGVHLQLFPVNLPLPQFFSPS